MDDKKMQRMDSEQRLENFGLDQIMQKLDIKEDDQIMDVGACTGAFSLPIANKTKEGHVYAVDVDAKPLEVLKRKILKKSIDNITPILIDTDVKVIQNSVFDSGLDMLAVEENSMDKIFICTVLHEVHDKSDFLTRYKRYLKDDGKIFIVEFASERRTAPYKAPDKAHAKRHFISQKDVKKLLNDTSFKNIEVTDINQLIYMISAERD
jgi:ubiquinone/menaquinone biosynthesis C-methylase UbiE